MDGRSLVLQGLLVLLAFATIHAQQSHGIAFPGDPNFPAEAVNRFVEPIKRVRTRERPSCTLLSADPSAPCDEDKEYNDSIKQLVSGLLARSRSVNEIVSDPALSVILNDSLTPPPPPNGATPSIRFGGPRESPACLSSEELIFPQRAKTPKNDWVFVVNQEGVRQALRVERCNKEGEQCRIGIPNTRDVSTVCRQKYVYRRMLVVGSNNIEPEEVLMPSCCVCYISQENFDVPSNRELKRNTFDIASRTGIGNSTTSKDVPVAQPGTVGPQAVPVAPERGPAGPQSHHVSHARPVHPVAGTPIGFNQPERINHNIRRSSGGYTHQQPFYYPMGNGR